MPLRQIFTPHALALLKEEKSLNLTAGSKLTRGFATWRTVSPLWKPPVMRDAEWYDG